MIDHVLGRPSTKSRRLQVLAVIAFWTAYLVKGNKNGPPLIQRASRFLSRKLTAWQTVVVTMLYLYASHNFSTLVGLSSPDPLTNMYTTSYFRATWILTALDAGFWTAMKIRTKWVRDLASIVFSVFYLFAAERADEKVRKVRSMLTVDHLRVSWNKGTTPYLRFFQNLMRPRFSRWPPRAVRIPRPSGSDYKEPVAAWLYYDGPLADLAHHEKVVLDIPGGGFVAMDPRCNDDKLFAWAAKTGYPVLALDYKKAPEFPYPYAINECLDVYVTLIKSRGRCIGMSGKTIPRVVITGDSAGGNLATATTLMIIDRSLDPLDHHSRRGVLDIPLPDGLVLMYPALDMNIGNWMSDEQMRLIRDRKMRRTNRSIVRTKTLQYEELVGTPLPSDDEDDVPSKNHSEGSSPTPASGETSNLAKPASTHPEFAHCGPETLSTTGGPAAEAKRDRATSSASYSPPLLQTRLAVSSMISYFNDRVITPEMMRAMIILYIGPHNRPDFSKDYLLSPVLAPDALLAHFPRTHFLTGERDPLVDDTVVFAGRLRRIKESIFDKAHQSKDEASRPVFNIKDSVDVALLPGISHGFMQFPSAYPPAWKLIDRTAQWIEDSFVDAQAARDRDRRNAQRVTTAVAESITPSASTPAHNHTDEKKENEPRREGPLHHFRVESSGDEDRPLEISMTKLTRANRNSPRPESTTTHTPANDAAVTAPTVTATASPLANGTNGTNGVTEDQDMEARRDKAKKKGKGKRLNKRQSLIKLNSSDDLLGRRMQGLTSGLSGGGEDE